MCINPLTRGGGCGSMGASREPRVFLFAAKGPLFCVHSRFPRQERAKRKTAAFWLLGKGGWRWGMGSKPSAS